MLSEQFLLFLSFSPVIERLTKGFEKVLRSWVEVDKDVSIIELVLKEI